MASVREVGAMAAFTKVYALVPQLARKKDFASELLIWLQSRKKVNCSSQDSAEFQSRPIGPKGKAILVAMLKNEQNAYVAAMSLY